MMDERDIVLRNALSNMTAIRYEKMQDAIDVLNKILDQFHLNNWISINKFLDICGIEGVFNGSFYGWYMLDDYLLFCDYGIKFQDGAFTFVMPQAVSVNKDYL